MLLNTQQKLFAPCISAGGGQAPAVQHKYAHCPSRLRPPRSHIISHRTALLDRTVARLQQNLMLFLSEILFSSLQRKHNKQEVVFQTGAEPAAR